MTDYLDRLERLTSLFERGALSKEEFEREKALLLRSAGFADMDDSSAQPFWKRKWLLIGGGAVLVVGITAGATAALDVWGAGSSGEEAANENAAGRPRLVLDSVISFKDVSSCTPSSGFAGLLDDIARASSVENSAADGFIRIAGSDETLTPATKRVNVAGAEAALAAVRVDATWQGLHVKEIRTIRWDDGHGDGFRVRFAEGPGQAGSVLRQLGMDLPKLGTLERRAEYLIGFEADGSGSALVCASGATTSNDAGSSTPSD